MENLSFSLKRKRVKVTLENGEGGVTDYFLQDLTGKDRDSYMSHLANRIRLGPDGKPSGLKSFDGLQTRLVSLCLVQEDNNKPVKEDQIGKWPAAVVDGLFKAAQELSALGADADEQAGND